jgi:energy-coupling factor transporter transmembrane protein EcfT
MYFRLKLVYVRLEDEQKNKKFWEELIGRSVKLLIALIITALFVPSPTGLMTVFFCLTTLCRFVKN